MTTPCIVVLTARGPDRLLQEGGSQAWRLKPENARRVAYCVCVQNRHNGHWGGADQDHHHAFLIGRIREVEPSHERANRYIIKFSEYALIDFGNAWPGFRNPVRYGSLEEFGIADPNALDWKPVPKGGAVAIPAAGEDGDNEIDGVGPLNIPDAKAGLALGLGVPESAIEITVKF